MGDSDSLASREARLEARLDALESRLAYQEHWLDGLDRSLAEQQLQLTRLERLTELMRERLQAQRRALQAGSEDDGGFQPEDEVPPHY